MPPKPKMPDIFASTAADSPLRRRPTILSEAPEPAAPAAKPEKYTLLIPAADKMRLVAVEARLTARLGRQQKRSELALALFALLDDDPAVFEAVAARLSR